jgi:chemotaxis protein methyltransferase CheR
VAVPAEIVAAVASRLAAHAGLEPPAWVIEARVAARLDALGVDGDGYVTLLDAARGAGAGELAELVEAVRVGESRLFRHRPQVAALIDEVVPALRARLAGRSGRTVRVWSAGCAAGEEPYTLAAVLARALPGAAIEILATDVSADALEQARAACYPREAIEAVPAEWRDGFVVDGDVVRVRPELARCVRFERRNLVDGVQPRGFDLVWCRNVLIYFTAEARRRALDALIGALEPGGYLFVGYSETLRDVAGLEPVRSGEAVCYVRRGDAGGARRTPTPAAGVPVPMPLAAASSLRAARGSGRAAAATPTPTPTPVPGATPVAGVTPRPVFSPATVTPGMRVLRLRGTCEPVALTADLMSQLSLPGLRVLVIDLDAAALIPDEVAPVFRRARAAAIAAGIELGFRATRNGTRRWLRRHGLDDSASSPGAGGELGEGGEP